MSSTANWGLSVGLVVCVSTGTVPPALGATCVSTEPPADAIVLFAHSDTSMWQSRMGQLSPWPSEGGILIATREDAICTPTFGDHQLHIEFFVPVRRDPSERGNGNSGVYVHGDYEIQVIDSHGTPLDKGSSCGAIYGQYPPMVDASLPAGQWQSFDIFFRTARFDSQGQLTEKARLTVIHNGIYIHVDREADTTPTGTGTGPQRYGSLLLQYHGYPVCYRNIWVRPVPTEDERLTLSLPTGIGLDFVWIPPGIFPMGAEETDPDREKDERYHVVTLTKGFWMGTFEVTNRQFRAFRPDHPSVGAADKTEITADDNKPAVAVDYHDAEAFCRWVSEQTGWNVRLPTEAEWEYACRGGSKAAYSYGNDRTRLGEYAWYEENTDSGAQPVGRKRPNARGMYDVHGNVAEWVADWYADYPEGPQTDPAGPSTGSTRSYRGGSWGDPSAGCRCAARNAASAGEKSGSRGFRVACDPRE